MFFSVVIVTKKSTFENASKNGIIFTAKIGAKDLGTRKWDNLACLSKEKIPCFFLIAWRWAFKGIEDFFSKKHTQVSYKRDKTYIRHLERTTYEKE